MDKHTDNIDSLPDLNLGIWIALAAGLGLFMELMVIRIHSSYFQLFAYFKNVSLLSCFLGLGIGYARGSLRPLTTPFVLPFMAPWYISLPLMTWVFNLTFTRMVDCPMTKLENKLRRELGMREIKFFVGHYITWPIKRKFRARRKKEETNKQTKTS